MTAITDPALHRAGFISALLAALRPARPDQSVDEAARDRRDFVTEMVERCPEAFSSDHDVQTMLHMYPGRF